MACAKLKCGNQTWNSNGSIQRAQRQSQTRLVAQAENSRMVSFHFLGKHGLGGASWQAVST